MFEAGRGLTTRSLLAKFEKLTLEESKIEMSPDEARRMKHGDIGQGEHLVAAKMNSPSQKTKKKI